MATIVRYEPNGENYILLGTGFGAYKSARPGVFFGHLLPNEEEGQVSMAAVCGLDGSIQWTRSDDFTVIGVDGDSPSALLSVGG